MQSTLCRSLETTICSLRWRNQPPSRRRDRRQRACPRRAPRRRRNAQRGRGRRERKTETGGRKRATPEEEYADCKETWSQGHEGTSLASLRGSGTRSAPQTLATYLNPSAWARPSWVRDTCLHMFGDLVCQNNSLTLKQTKWFDKKIDRVGSSSHPAYLVVSGLFDIVAFAPISCFFNEEIGWLLAIWQLGDLISETCQDHLHPSCVSGDPVSQVGAVQTAVCSLSKFPALSECISTGSAIFLEIVRQSVNGRLFWKRSHLLLETPCDLVFLGVPVHVGFHRCRTSSWLVHIKN